MAGAASTAVEEEWELCNDHGFIYKRRKRGQPDEGLLLASSSAQPLAGDHETDLKRNRLARRKLSLMALRDRYRREIEQWEAVVASLQDGGSCGHSGGGDGRDLLHLPVEETAGQHGAATGAASTTSDHQESDEIAAPENPFSTLMEELMLQVEAQESILKKLSDICDIMDSACDVQEEAIMESLLDLPVWSSPRTLMSSLSE